MTDDKMLEQKQVEYAEKKAALNAKKDAKNAKLKEGRIFFHDRDVNIFPFRSNAAEGIIVGFLLNPPEVFSNTTEVECEDDVIVFAFSVKNDKDKYCDRIARGLIGHRLKEYLKNFTSEDSTRSWFEENVLIVCIPNGLSAKYLQSKKNSEWIPFMNLHNLFSLALLDQLLHDHGEVVKIPQKTKNVLISSVLNLPSEEGN